MSGRIRTPISVKDELKGKRVVEILNEEDSWNESLVKKTPFILMKPRPY